MKPSTRTLLGTFALASALCSPFVYAGPYTALYVFGDSLSDSGNDALITGGLVPSSPPYYPGRFSNGENYADQLADLLGLPLSASQLGGTNYAYGGARTAYVAAGLPPSAQSFNQQISGFTSSHASTDANALYTLWIGANDMSDVLIGANPAGSPGNSINVAVSGIVNAIQSLYLLGAENFLIPNLPDLGLVPEVLAFGPAASAQATFLTQTFNATLANALNSLAPLNLNIFQFDTFSLHQAIINQPGNYGFSNTTQACYDGYVDGSPLPTGTTPPTVCAAPNSYFYWDFEHPTAAVHQFFAQQMFEQVPEPSSILLTVLGLGLLGWHQRRSLSSATA